jgi:hypothetical protein
MRDDDEDEFLDEPGEGVDVGLSLSDELVYEGSSRPVPVPFTAATVCVDGRPQSRLDFAAAERDVCQLVERGHTPIFDLDLGFFQDGRKELTHKIQFQARAHTIDQFSDELWEKWQKHAPCAIVARLGCDFAKECLWGHETQDNFRAWLTEHHLSPAKASEAKGEEDHWLTTLFCRDCIVQYLELLTAHLPPKLLRLVLLDAENVPSPLAYAELTRRDVWKHFWLAVRRPPYPLPSPIWQEGEGKGYIGTDMGSYRSACAPTVGVILPGCSLFSLSAYASLGQAMETLVDKGIGFIVIPEGAITSEWDGLDTLVCSRIGLTTEGRRALQGFTAAGGQVLYTDDPLGVSGERHFDRGQMLDEIRIT